MPPLKIRSRISAQQARAPADENGRGIQIGHRRPAFQIHAEAQAEGMDDKGQHQQGKTSAPHRLGQIDPEQAAQQQRGDVNDHALVKRLDLVEEKFLLAFLQRRIQVVFLHPDAVFGDGLVEFRRFVVVIGAGHLRVNDWPRDAIPRCAAPRIRLVPMLDHAVARLAGQRRDDQRIGQCRPLQHNA